MIRIGLTGGVASGKSTALTMLKELGCHTVSSDEITHKLFEKNKQLVNKIKTEFNCVDLNGVIERERLAKLIFNDEKQKNKLENIIHPLVKSIRNEFFKISETRGNVFAICETPLLFEKKLMNEFDYTIVVVASLDERIDRFINSGGSQEKFFEIAKNQMLDSQKIAMADFVIKNKGSKDELKNRLKTILEKIAKDRNINFYCK